MKTYKVVAAIVIIVLTGCKKKSEPTRTDYLVSGNWKVVKLDVKVGASGTWTDGFAAMADCKKDDEFIFLGTGVYNATEGVTKCNPADPQVFATGSWTLSADIKQITLPGNVVWTIEKLDATEFISTSAQDRGPVTYYFRQTMRH